MIFTGLKVGVLELQGDFAEHSSMMRRCGANVVPVRLPKDLEGIDGLVLPGGESTTIGKLLRKMEMLEKVQQMARDGLPVFGTCAGCILLAKHVVGFEDMLRIGSMDITVTRNAYGPQIESSETDVDSEHWVGKKLHVVHIRAPAIEHVGDGVKVLASLGERPVLVQEGNMLACTFHPELTADTRVHELFLQIIIQSKNQKKGC